MLDRSECNGAKFTDIVVAIIRTGIVSICNFHFQIAIRPRTVDTKEPYVSVPPLNPVIMCSGKAEEDLCYRPWRPLQTMKNVCENEISAIPKAR